MDYKTVTVRIADGMDDNKSPLDAATPGIQYAENVDYSRLGEVHGRPGYVLHDATGLRTLDTVSVVGPGDPGLLSLRARSQYKPRTMFRHRDSTGERPGMMTDGRMFTWEGDRWTDRLYGGAAKVDRLVELLQFQTDVVLNTKAVGDNFMPISGGPGNSPVLGASNPSIEAYLPGRTLFGNAANVTTGGHTYHCVLGNDGATNNLYLIVRRDNDIALTSYTLFADCAIPTDRGDNPCISGDDTAGNLVVGYIPVGGGNYTLAQVNPATGATSSKVTTVLAGINGLWITSVSSKGYILCALTRAAVKGVLCRQHSSVNDNLVGGTDGQLDSGAGTNPAGPVTIGYNTTIWVSYCRYIAGSPGAPGDPQDAVFGTYDAGTFGTQVYKAYLGFGTPNLTWSLTHPMIAVGSRSILGLAAGQGQSGAIFGHTWYELDITDMVPATGGIKAGGTVNPVMLAIGPQTGSAQFYSPGSAILQDAQTWRFPSIDYRTFDAITGTNPSIGLNQVQLQSPQVASAGEQTLIGGSVPHMVAKGWACEVGFPFLGAPEIFCTLPVAGGALPAGSWTVQALWRWTDEAGTVHRSGPSLPFTISPTDGTHKQINVTALNCQLTEREFGPAGPQNPTIYLEIYSTDVNPPTIAPKYLVNTILQTAGTATTSTSFNLFSNTLEPLYTAAGAVFANIPVSADGGVAVVGKRVWLSDGVRVFASKLLRGTNQAPAWNDEGVLQVNVPSTAGRVIALEGMDDKLVILCERGIFVTHGEGPDDTGSGPDFLYPVKISDLGIAGARSSQGTDKGVIFHARNTAQVTGDTAYGGLWLVDRGMGIQTISLPAQDRFAAAPAELDYIPERQLFVATTATGLLTWDMRTNQWAVWTTLNPPTSITTSMGVLWTLDVPTGSYGTGAYSATPGTDLGIAGVSNVAMTVTTNHLFANGQDGLGWSRVRSLKILGEPATHTLTMTAVLDQQRTLVSRTFNLVQVPGNPVTWPTDRYAPEWRLPFQKCSSIQLTLQATPCTGAWVAARLEILPTEAPAPSRFRQ